MSRIMLVDAAHPEEIRVVIADEKSSILEFDFTTASKPQIKGNVYLAKVTRVEPSLQAAFVEYGGNKQGFLPFSEIHPNYYQIPTSDRDKLLAEEAEDAARDALDDDDLADDIDGESDDVTNTLAERAESNDSISSNEIAPNVDDIESSGAGKDSDDENDSLETSNEENQASEEQSNSDKPRRRRGRGRSRNDRNGRNKNRREQSNDDSDSDIETISSEDEIERPNRKERAYNRRYKIQEVIKRNQVLLVQIVKEERGNKGVSLTTFLSLAGRYCVLMPNSPRGGGVSRKINNRDDRKRLKKILNDLELPQGMNVIIRTAGAGRTRVEIRRDFDYLVKLWNQIREQTLSSTAPALTYEESNIIQRSIRDSYNNDIDSIMVQGEQTHKETKAFMKMLIPSHAPRVKLHKSDVPLFHKYGIEDQLLSMTEPEVRLKAGGSIVMVPTEALISIDVNSGRSTKERNVEETAYKTNLEAAKEIARQLRLRDLAGLVVIDFIDMMEGRNRRAVERTLKEALKSDRAKIQVGRISSFGLLEMSRQRLRPSISESINRLCPQCQGIGNIRSNATVAIQIIRNLEKEASTGNVEKFDVSVTAEEALYIFNNMRGEIAVIESSFNCKVDFVIEESLHEGTYKIEKSRKSKSENTRSQTRNNPRHKTSDDVAQSDSESDNNASHSEPDSNAQSGDERPPRNKRRRGGRRNRKNRDNYDENNSSSSDTQNSDNTQSDANSNKNNENSVSEIKGDSEHSSPVQTSKADSSNDDVTSPKKDNADKPKPRRTRTAKPKAKKAEDLPKNDTDNSTKSSSDKTEAHADSAEITVTPAPKRRGRPPAKKKDDSGQANSEPQKKPTEKNKPAEIKTEPKKANDEPKRKGWWQKIID